MIIGKTIKNSEGEIIHQVFMIPKLKLKYIFLYLDMIYIVFMIKKNLTFV